MYLWRRPKRAKRRPKRGTDREDHAKHIGASLLHMTYLII